MKKVILCIIHVFVCISLVFGIIYYVNSDENRVEHDVTVNVVKIIQEDHKSSTTYRGVFQLDNGTYIDFEVSASTFATARPGDRLIYKLNNYQTKKAEDKFPKPLGFMVIFFFLYFFVGSALVFGYCTGDFKK